MKRKILALVFAVIVVFSCINASYAYTTTWVQIPASGLTVDTLDGVPAKYILGSTNTGPYCCAAYAKNYFAAVHGKEIHNLLPGQIPVCGTPGYHLQEAPTVSGNLLVWKGMLAFWTVSSTGSSHSAIVKSVSGPAYNLTITLIEQNFKSKIVEGSNEKASFERKISATEGGVKFYYAMPD